MDENDNDPAPSKFGADFQHLTPTLFEELCFELLQEIGFVNVDWRKGTAADASPADQGRDIQCQLRVRDPDGFTFLETWFVDCKHYKTSGVPPTALMSTLAWAEAERPQVVLFICSGWFSNPCKENLEKQAPGKKYRIRRWERKELEGFLFRDGRTRLAAKYGVFSPGNSALMHPSHFYFVTQPRLYSAAHFFKVLKNVDPKIREQTIRRAFVWVFGLESRAPKFGKETFGELITTPITLENLEEAFQECSINPRFIVFGLLAQSLVYSFYAADTTGRDELEIRLKGMLEHLEGENSPSESQRAAAQHLRDQLGSLDERYEQAYDDYIQFCQQVILPVTEEPEPEFMELLDYDLPGEDDE